VRERKVHGQDGSGMASGKRGQPAVERRGNTSKNLKDLSFDNQDRILVLTVLYVPSLLDSGLQGDRFVSQDVLIDKFQRVKFSTKLLTHC